MTARLAVSMMALVVVGAVIAATVGSVTTDESASAFHERGPASPLVELASERGIEVLRLLSGPGAFSTDSAFEPSSMLLVLIAPEKPFKVEEAEIVRQFIVDGGNLLVADDFGHANSITSQFGLTFERVRLVEQHADAPVEASIEGNTIAVGLDEPTSLRLEASADATVMAVSSSDSFLDRDGNGVINAGDPIGPFPLAAALDIGPAGGRLVAVSDTAPFLRESSQAAENPEFRRALLDILLPDGGRMIIDESRVPTNDPWLRASVVLTGIVTSGPWLYAVGLVVVGLLILGILTTTGAAWARHRFLPDRFLPRAALRVVDDATKPAAEASNVGTQWTTRGRVALFGGVALGWFGLMLGNPQASTAGALLLAATALAVWYRPVRLDGRRDAAPPKAQENALVNVKLEISSAGGRGGEVEIRDPLPPEFDMVRGQNWFETRVTSGQTAQFEYEVRPSVRGPYQVGPLLARSHDPFRLRTAQAEVVPAESVVVHPRHEPLSRIPFPSKTAAMTLGPHLVNRAGDGSEFHSLRGYQTGDSIRIVNWKASARSKELVVNQRVHESMATLTIFIDARAIAAAGPVSTSPINEACRAALSIATGAVQARDRIRVFAYGQGLEDLAPGTGLDQIHHLTDALAMLPAQGETTFVEAVEPILPSLRVNAPFVLITGMEEDDSIVDGLNTLRRRGILPTVLAVRPGTRSHSDPAGEVELDADVIEASYEETMQTLRGLSIPAVPVKPGMPLSASLRLGVA